MCAINPKYWELVEELKDNVFKGENIETEQAGLIIMHETLNSSEYLSENLKFLVTQLLKEKKEQGLLKLEDTRKKYQGIIVLLPWVCKKTGKDYGHVKDIVKTIIDASIDVNRLCLNRVLDNWKGEPIDDERIHLLCLYET